MVDADGRTTSMKEILKSQIYRYFCSDFIRDQFAIRLLEKFPAEGQSERGRGGEKEGEREGERRGEQGERARQRERERERKEREKRE